ncbi:Cytochrome c oxidase subunit 3 [Bienertia sinuspersici]
MVLFCSSYRRLCSFLLFWAFSHSSLALAVEIGGIWPPKGIWVLDPREIPFLNTVILLTSGAAVTWAHHAILVGKQKRAVYALVATILLALVFTGFQRMEYYEALFTILDNIYGSTFFLATAFMLSEMCVQTESILWPPATLLPSKKLGPGRYICEASFPSP